MERPEMSDLSFGVVRNENTTELEMVRIPKDWLKLSQLLRESAIPPNKVVLLKNFAYVHLKLVMDVVEHIRTQMNGMYKMAHANTLELNTVKFDDVIIPAVSQASNKDRIIATNLAQHLRIGIAKKYLLQYYANRIMNSNEHNLNALVEMMGSEPLTREDCVSQGLNEDNALWRAFPSAKKLVFNNQQNRR